MKNEKMHLIDVIFFYGITIIGITGALIDVFYWKDKSGGFPVYSCMSMYISYALWIILLLYSTFKYQEESEKPQYVKGFMFFLLPFLQIAIILITFIIANLILNMF